LDLSDYVRAVSSTKMVPALNAILLQAMDTFGAAAISGYEFPYGGDVSTGREPIITTWPEEVSKAYRAQMAGEDPLMYAAMTLGTPVHFLSINESLHFSENSSAVIDIMRANGFKDGVTTPVFAKPGAFAYFAAAFREERHDMTEAEMRLIKIVFSEYYFRYRELTRIQQSVLSNRERQVLVAIVNNKSNSEIATLMNVSEHTVGTYVRRCFDKLDVNSRTQAVLRYIGGGASDIPAD